MTDNREPATGEVTLPAFFTVRELAKLGNVTYHVMKTLLRQAGVQRIRVGHRQLVAMSELKRTLPVVFKSLHLLEGMRRARKRGNRR